MTGLREELDRLAEQAPAVHVPGDTWARARVAERRARLARAGAVAAVVVLVALVAGLVAVRPGPDLQPARPGDDGLAVPDRVWAVPERMAARDQDGWAREEVSGELAVGAGAVAFATSAGLPVVVDAAEGEYHLLDLPGFLANDRLAGTVSGSVGLALAPDGQSLAYGYADLGPESVEEPVPSGVRVLDLITGEVAEWPVVGEEGTVVEQLAWSPDGRWLAWAGERAGSWTPMSVGSSTPIVGRLRLEQPGVVDEAPSGVQRGGDASVGIADDGVVLAAVGDTLRRWDGRVVRPVADLGDVGFRDGVAVAAVTGRVAVGDALGGTVTVVGPDGRASQLPALPATAGAAVEEGEGGSRPLGWVDDETLLVRTERSEAQTTVTRLVLVRAGSDPRVVTEVDDWSAAPLTVAVDLVDPADPSVPRPEPDFPWAPEAWGWAAAGALLAGGLLGLGVVHARRRRTGVAQRSGTKR